MTKNENTNLQAIQAVITAIANSKNIVAASKNMVADIMPEIIKGLTSKDFEKVANILFQKVGKITFYQAYLAGYFEACHVLLKYIPLKKTFVWYGDFNDLKKLSYSEYLEKAKEEKEKYVASLSMSEKLDKRYSSIEKLDKAGLEYLAGKIKNILKSKI